MNNPNLPLDAQSTPSNFGETGAKVAKDAVNVAHQQADKALDDVAHGTKDLLGNLGAGMDQASDRASDLAHRGADAVRRAAHQLREGADRASTRTANYVNDEPLKALLMAAAAGAVLAAVLGMVSQSRRRY